MDCPPQFLLDALKDSISSGTFIDTKFFVFSRRDASGRVGAPRPLYCNGHVLSAVPYFSTLFSDGFSEGQMRDINEGFPLDSTPHTEHYDYLSDSDLEDEDDEDGGEPYGNSGTKVFTGGVGPRTPRVPPDSDKQQSNGSSIRLGKVAVIRDIAAVTLEAMIFFLYTGKIMFAPLSSDQRYEVPAEERVGDWNMGRVPYASAKSIYRLADKYDIPTLKEQAKAHIYDNLAHCDIVDEVFSTFSFSFSEILSLQVSRLVSKMKEESTGGAESITRRQLREKIASLSQSQLARASDTLAMIWDSVIGLADGSATGPKPPSSAKPTFFRKWHRVIIPQSSKGERVKLALLKSIATGTFIDVQFYAYNAICNDLPTDLKPLFTSSIVIESWAPAITTQTVGEDSQATPLVDGLTDDYECWHGEIPGSRSPVLKHQTEAAEGREFVMLTSGAWRTWVSLLSYIYTKKMDFAPLLTSARDGTPVTDPEVKQQQRCSPRSMYALTTALGIKKIKGIALKDVKSKLTTSNVAQELFTSFAANYQAVMDMEIEFLFRNFSETNPKAFMEHIQRMASGEAQFFPKTLSLVYDNLAERALTQPTTSGPGSGNPTETENQTVAEPTPTTQAPDITVNADSSPTPNVPLLPGQQPPAPGPDPDPIPLGAVWLECFTCGQRSRMRDLHDSVRCPRCPSRGSRKGRPFMRCPSCNLIRNVVRDTCVRFACQTRFV